MEILKSFPTLSSLRASQPNLRALLFDMDGTLFQTEEHHADVLRQMAQEWKIVPPFPPHELEDRLKGMADRQVLELARNWQGFPAHFDEASFIAEKNKKLLELIPQTPIERWCSQDLVGLLHEAKQAQLLTAVVTSSERVITDQFLHTSQLRPLFDLVITLQDVTHPKPHPAPYLQAMLHLNVGPRDTLIFEDSRPGLEAATRAGARVIEVQWWKNYSSGLKT
ncbi:MAG: HAD family hydrolase [Bacteriovoracia bacterium]